MNQQDTAAGTKRIEKVVVQGLFGTFDHEIPLNKDERITIIHGLNGYGKTMILRMLAALTSGDYKPLRTTLFGLFEITLEGGLSIRVVHDSKNSNIQISITEDNWESCVEEGIVWDGDEQESQGILPIFLERKRIKSLIPAVHFLGIDRIYDFDLLDRLLKYERKFPRLEFRKRALENVNGIPTVLAHAKTLAEKIERKRSEFSKFAQSLDTSFPSRLIEQLGNVEVDEQTVKQRLGAIEEQRQLYAKVGLFPYEAQALQIPAKGLAENKWEILAIYADDTEKKLDVLSDFAERLNLMLDIVNQRFHLKTLSFSDQDGFVFVDHQDNPIPLDKLSSGEQHHIVMLYNMLFEYKPGSLVLIDEPELSLHVGWAQAFVKDLLKITALTGIDVLMATHSPNLIHDRWDLTVELKGPKQT